MDYFKKNREILQSHLTLAQRERLGSLEIVSVPYHATLTEVINILTPIFAEINKPDELLECKRLTKYLIGWRFKEDPRK